MSERDLCNAIEQVRRIEFSYQGSRRLVAPYIVYEDVDTGEILLDGMQVNPTGRMRTFRVADITNITLEQRFLPTAIDSGAPRYEKTICVLEA